MCGVWDCVSGFGRGTICSEGLWVGWCVGVCGEGARGTICSEGCGVCGERGSSWNAIWWPAISPYSSYSSHPISHSPPLTPTHSKLPHHPSPPLIAATASSTPPSTTTSSPPCARRSRAISRGSPRITWPARRGVFSGDTPRSRPSRWRQLRTPRTPGRWTSGSSRRVGVGDLNEWCKVIVLGNESSEPCPTPYTSLATHSPTLSPTPINPHHLPPLFRSAWLSGPPAPPPATSQRWP